MAEARAFNWKATAIGAGIINAAINAPIGWFMMKEGATLGAWSVPGIALDLAITGFAVGFATGLIATPQMRKQFRDGKLRRPTMSYSWRRDFQNWPTSILHRSINLGILADLLFLPLPLLALWIFGIDEAGRVAVTWMKGGFACIVGAFVTPVIGIAASVDRG